MKNVILVLILCGFLSHSTSSKNNFKPLNLVTVDSLILNKEDSLNTELNEAVIHLQQLTDTLQKQQKILNAN